MSCILKQYSPLLNDMFSIFEIYLVAGITFYGFFYLLQIFFNQKQIEDEPDSEDLEDTSDESYYKPFILKLKGRNFKKIFNEK